MSAGARFITKWVDGAIVYFHIIDDSVESMASNKKVARVIEFSNEGLYTVQFWSQLNGWNDFMDVEIADAPDPQKAIAIAWDVYYATRST